MKRWFLRASRAAKRLGGASSLLAIVALVVFFWPGATEGLEFDRAAIGAGELWRLLTGHWTHWSFEHLFWDVIVLVVLGVLCERTTRGAFGATVVLSALAISTSVWFARPDLAFYRGLSGLDSALFVLYGVLVIRRHRLADWRGVAMLVALAGFVGKILFEFVTGDALLVDAQSAGFSVVIEAHVVGAAIGFLAAFVVQRKLPVGADVAVCTGGTPVPQRAT
ncbi:MAG: rhombosortase [Planctomycetes bacterium]|nr:rhombosortase [Planctomycetota bacterium]